MKFFALLLILECVRLEVDVVHRKDEGIDPAKVYVGVYSMLRGCRINAPRPKIEIR